mmetsp:Transcript_52689/g.96441  ORF Transcript_52689/g.96441 Transcript_52689/m.96441 type:complete len:234 (+) Transcript_52689:84-785(+)
MNAPSADSIMYQPVFLRKEAYLKDFPFLEPPPGLFECFADDGVKSPTLKFCYANDEDKSPTSTTDEHGTTTDEHGATTDENGAESENEISAGLSSGGEGKISQAEDGENESGKLPRGSEGHLNGQCKPCAYFWSQADGCRRGDDCDFCHLCDSSAMKKWRKAKKQRVQAEIARARAWAARARQARQRQGGQSKGAVKIVMPAVGEPCTIQASHLLAFRPDQAILLNAPPSPWW